MEATSRLKTVGQWHLMMVAYLRSRLNDTQRYLVIWVVTGLACGLAAVAFHLAIDELFAAIRALAWGQNLVHPMVVMIAAPTLGGLLTGWIIHKYSPHSAGSGIPQTKARYYLDFGRFKWVEAFWRFIVGTISTGSGMSLGREGPTVHICSVIASKIGEFFGLAQKRVQAMVPIGMGAGIAAAFNTPMAAMFFVFEELLGDFSSRALFGILISVVIAAIVERTLLGEGAIFFLQLPAFSTSTWMLVCIPMGVAAGFGGELFVKWLLKLRARSMAVKVLPLWVMPGVGGLMVGLVGCTAYYLTGMQSIWGMGYSDLNAALNGKMTVLYVVAILFVCKFLATIVAYSSGGSGGIFAPVLYIGGMMGCCIGLLGQHFMYWDPSIVGAVALLGMGAFFASVIRCPLTSIVIIFEMTRNYTLMLPLMIGNMIAYAIAHKLRPISIYDALLIQNKVSLKKMPHYQGEQDWKNLSVQSIMTFAPVTVNATMTASQNLKTVETRTHHSYPVVDKDGGLVTVVTNFELLQWAKSHPDKPLNMLPSWSERKRITITTATSIREAATHLIHADVMQAPVVDPLDERKLLGILTLHDITRQQNTIEDAMGR